MNETKRLIARFYRTAAGNQPARDWLVALADADRRIVGRDIAKIEFGWPIGSPICRPVRGGLYEVRSTIREGSLEARVSFGLDGSFMVLLDGYEKRPASQARHIELAHDRWDNYLKRTKR